jgi:Fe-Mn family superoxide dismutase
MTPMIEGTEYASMPIEDIVKKSYSDNPKLFNQAASTTTICISGTG